MHTIWKKQIDHSLKWLSALFASGSETLERTFRVDDFMGRGQSIEIGTDALPWDLGGWLSIDGQITKYFRSKVSASDRRIFGLVEGSCEGQQILESLAILVAIRLWLPSSQERIQLTVRGDNVGSLIMVIKMRPKSPQQAIIARELALCFAKFSFLPAVYHTPGVAHVLADRLSRYWDPSKPDSSSILQHPAIAQAVESVAPERDESYYLTL